MRHDNNASNGSGNNNDGNDEDYKANDDIRAACAPISSFDHCASSGASNDSSKRNFRQICSRFVKYPVVEPVEVVKSSSSNVI